MSTKPQEQEYGLNRDSEASARLTYQHNLYVNRLGYLLHPHIAKALKLTEHGRSESQEPIHVLDLATGNGIWAMDFAHSASGFARPVQVTGLDISSAMFPIRQSWHSNVSFGTYDLMQEPPTEYVEKFDVIQIRFIMAVIWRDTAIRDKVMKNFGRMLKPGGYLQWMEPRPPVWCSVALGDDGTARPRDEQAHAFQVLEKYLPVEEGMGWVRELDKVLAEVGGYEETQLQQTPFRRDQLSYESLLMRWSHAEGISHVLKALKDEAAKKEILEAFEQDFRDIDAGKVVYAGNYVVAVGRKPL